LFFPYGDTPNPKGFTPWMTRLLILANFAVYFLITSPLSSQLAAAGDPGMADYIGFLAEKLAGPVPQSIISHISKYDLYTFAHGYQPGNPSVGDLFFSLFLHGGIWHLLGNMFFLWIYGDNAEHRLGRIGFLAAYLITGVAATLAYGLIAGDSMAPLVGASGAISGILGIYFILFPKNLIKVFVFLFPFLVTRWYVPARIVLGIYLLADNLLPLVLGNDTGVAYGAHIGGFGAGLLIGLGVKVFAAVPGWFKRKFGRREVIRDIPKTRRPDPRSIIIDAEYVDDDGRQS
jgi:membrane associated rhomboid family serine protease